MSLAKNLPVQDSHFSNELVGSFTSSSFPKTEYSQVSNFLKRALDLVLASLGLLFLSPVFLIISILIKLTSKGPIFFVQNRVGLSGKIFKMYKFRTMIVNAEKIKKDLLSQNEMDGPAFKMRNDPRITSIGKFLRKTSLDELPQLLNVILSDMSLVGPRPSLEEEVREYRKWHTRRLSVKPGITCIWQVFGRNQVSFDQWVLMDLEYIDNRSLKLDIILLFKTLRVVLFQPNGR